MSSRRGAPGSAGVNELAAPPVRAPRSARGTARRGAARPLWALVLTITNMCKVFGNVARALAAMTPRSHAGHLARVVRLRLRWSHLRPGLSTRPPRRRCLGDHVSGGTISRRRAPQRAQARVPAPDALSLLRARVFRRQLEVTRSRPTWGGTAVVVTSRLGPSAGEPPSEVRRARCVQLRAASLHFPLFHSHDDTAARVKRSCAQAVHEDEHGFNVVVAAPAGCRRLRRRAVQRVRRLGAEAYRVVFTARLCPGRTPVSTPATSRSLMARGALFRARACLAARWLAAPLLRRRATPTACSTALAPTG